MKYSNKLTICASISNCKNIVNQSSLSDSDKENLKDMLDSIRVKAQHMENRLFRYKTNIEDLGFKRIKSKQKHID
jgi:translation initiation factor 2B subunit (eIF-2B alpha/beta/delta family)